MDPLLALHMLAAPRSEGLDRALRTLLEERAAMHHAGIPQLRPNESGPLPSSRPPSFQPGNVVPLASYRREGSARPAKSFKTR